jgi:hypothetical protein
MWTEAVALAELAHKTFPSVHFIGWDIAILQDRAVVIEGNPFFNADATGGMTQSSTRRSAARSRTESDSNSVSRPPRYIPQYRVYLATRTGPRAEDVGGQINELAFLR